MAATNNGPAVTTTENPTALMQGRPDVISASRQFYNGSDGKVYDCITASAITLTIPKGLNWSKGVVVELPVSGVTVTIQGDGVAVQINGATASLTRTLSATQRVISIYPRSAPDSFEVSGS